MANLAKDLLDERDALLTRVEAAQYLRRSATTLGRWARQGVGPKPYKPLGAGPTPVYYRLADLRAITGGAAPPTEPKPLPKRGRPPKRAA